MGTGSFPGVKSRRGVTLTPHPLLMPWSWQGRATPLLPLWAVWPVQSLSACTRVQFTFSFFIYVCMYVIWYYVARDIITKLSVTSNNRVHVSKPSIPNLNPRFHSTDRAVFWNCGERFTALLQQLTKHVRHAVALPDYQYQCVIGLSVCCHRAFRFYMNTSAVYSPLHQRNNAITVFNLILDTAMLRKRICRVWCRPNPAECAVQLISDVSMWLHTSRFPSADRRSFFIVFYVC